MQGGRGRPSPGGRGSNLLPALNIGHDKSDSSTTLDESKISARQKISPRALVRDGGGFMAGKDPNTNLALAASSHFKDSMGSTESINIEKWNSEPPSDVQFPDQNESGKARKQSKPRRWTPEEVSESGG